MKNTKKCPKCDSTEIVRLDGSTMRQNGNMLLTGMSVFTAVSVNTYICLNCGYTEEWIDEGDLYLIRNSKKAKTLE